MSTKPKNTTTLWKNRLLDSLRFAISFEAKVNLNPMECMELLAKVLPGPVVASDGSATDEEYVFEPDKNKLLQRFNLIKTAKYGRRHINVYLAGELQEELNLDVTTITVKIYPDFMLFFFGFIPSLINLFALVLIVGTRNRSLMDFFLTCLVLLFFAGFTLSSTCSNFRDRQVIKDYFLARLETVAENRAVPLLTP